ncbi:unnamed protein product [Spirodela intermedia]|uniref:Uncharacterized protein n=2 Tax=Spirodela intermedia TaxID=51605 RepID=A0A7I8J8V1_SPIIN|nr:unnamed protein product [Spirodela intermedia]CAA6665872.1 unnamed protein product [Spirodela intermedia]CAA7402635.1 unnamed protein product [Spirodela intermedia]
MARHAIVVIVFLSLFVLSTAAQLPAVEAAGADEHSFATFEPRTTEEQVPIDSSFIPIVRGFPAEGLRLTDRPIPIHGRPGHHCQHGRRRFHRGLIVPFGDDMVISGEEMRRIHLGRRGFLGRKTGGGEWKDMGEISLSDLMKHKELGAPREFRHSPRDTEHGALRKHFWNVLNRRI